MSAPRRPILIGSARWIVTLGSLTALIALSIDMSLPAQPTLSETFAVPSETAGLTLSTFMIGFAVAQLVVGYLSDAWGRRSVIVGGLVLYTVASIACALAPTIEVLLVCRVLQGVGGSAAPVVARAMVRDTQPAQAAARILSTMLAVLAIAPMVAPSIGGLLLELIGWRSIFATLGVCGLALMIVAHGTLEETLSVERRLASPSPAGLVRGFRTFFGTPGTKLPVLISCASFAGQFAYIADSPFVYMQGFGVSERAYGVYFGMTALALIIGSITGGRMLRAGRSPRAMIIIGTAIILGGGIALAIATRTGVGIAGFLVPMIVYFFGVGIASPSSTALALEPVPHIAGTASAAIGFLTMISGATAGYLTTKIGGADPHAFSNVAAVMAVLTAVFAVLTASTRRRKG